MAQGEFDLTTKNIQDTFMSVVQVTGSNDQLYHLDGRAVNNLRVSGSITAEQYIVSSSVTFLTQSFSSGSTIFGDTPADDTHKFSGSVDISGSSGITISAGGATITSGGITVASGNISGSSSTTGSFGRLQVNTIAGNASLVIDNTFTPAVDNLYNIGSASNRWADVFSAQTTTGGIFEVGLRTENIGQLETGTVVVWEDGELIPCYSDSDELVMGVIKEGKDEPIILGAEPVLVTGKVDVGDFIVTSAVEGHGKAEKRGSFIKKDLFGKVIAQALEASSGDSSLIKCMVRKM